MRKITSLFALFLLVAGTAVAQITALPTDGDMCYNIKTAGRGWWFVESGGTSVTSTTKAGFATSTTDKKQLFQFKTVDGTTYLYSTSEKKYISKSGQYTTLTDDPVQGVYLQATTNSSYPTVITFADGSQAGVSNGYSPAVITFWNNLTDAGNQVAIVEVATEEEIDNAITVTYNVVYDGQVVASQSGVSAIAGRAPQLPDALQNYYCTYTYDVETLTTSTTVVNATATASAPFEFSTDVDNAKWYYMTLRGHYVYYNEEGGYVCTNQSTYDATSDAYKWAFLGTPYGVKVVNKATGTYLDNTSSNVQLSATGYAWTLAGLNATTFGLYNGSNYINEQNHPNHYLIYYTQFTTDTGSQFTVTEVPAAFGTVTYNVYDNGTVVASSTQENVGVGTEISEAPASLIASAMTGGVYTYTVSSPITVAEGANEFAITRSAISNTKSYNLIASRGQLGVRDNRLASTGYSGSITDGEFAVISYEGNYYLWSVADAAFIVGSAGNEVESQDPTASYNFTTTSYPYLLKQGELGVNISSQSNGYNVIINSWTTADAGNQYALVEVGTFDPTNVLALLDYYFHTSDKTAEVVAEVYPYIFADPTSPATSDVAASVGQPFGITPAGAAEFVNTYGANIANNSFNAEEYEAAKALVAANIATPADGFYRVKNVSTGKYLRAINLGARGGVVADLTAEQAASDAASVIEVRTIDEKPYMLSNTGWFNWVYASSGYEGYVAAAQDKYVHWLAVAPGQGAFSIALGNGEGTYASYLNSGYYTVQSDNTTIGGAATSEAAYWVFEPATDVTVNMNVVGDASYATAVFPYPVQVAGAKVMRVQANTAAGKAFYFETANTVPAGTPVMLVAEDGAATATATIVDSADELTEQNDLVANYFAGNVTDALVLGASSGVIGFYKLSATGTLGANRAYIDNSTSSDVRALVLAAGETTGISNVATEAAQNGKAYDLAGRRVQNVQNGLYIINGKKVLVK